MSDQNKTQDDTKNIFRKVVSYVRFLAALFIIVAVLQTVYALIDYLFFDAYDFPYEELLGDFFMLILGLIFWYLPGKLISSTQQFNDEHHTNGDETTKINASTKTENYQYQQARITDSEPPPTSEDATLDSTDTTHIKPDPYGTVFFDSTRRPLRIMGGIFGMVLGLIIFLIIWAMSDSMGMFEYLFLGGWFTFALLVMGFVYEVRINKSMGSVERKTGWFFITFKHHYPLRDFDKIVVTSRFFRSTYDQIRERYHRQDPKFKVDLIGNRKLNLYVFSSLIDAKETGQAVADYYKFPLVEFTEVSS